MPQATARRPIQIVFWCLLLAALAARPLLAQAPPAADTFVSSRTAKTNYGSAIALVVCQGSTSHVQFNLAGIPPGPIFRRPHCASTSAELAATLKDTPVVMVTRPRL